MQPDEKTNRRTAIRFVTVPDIAIHAWDEILGSVG
jgi:hypothetical protein